MAAPSTGQGKTTIATGLMAALRLAGHEVSGHKVGPDYIAPGYHALATGRPGRNLDPHLVGEERIVPLLLHGACGADVSVIEGVMGLHDGRLGTDGFASTAHVAKLTQSPVILVLDVARMSRSVAAIALGMSAFDEEVDVAGVVLNRTGSARNDAEIATAIERAGLPMLGRLPRDEQLATPSRHLGLVTAAERGDSEELVRRLGEQVARHLDLDALIAVARRAPDLDGEAWDPRTEVARPDGTDRPVIAVAGGRAFTFRYPEAEELLTEAGCEVVEFDPMTDTELPAGTRALLLGGGFPEVYAAELAANRPLLAHLRAAVDAGVPTVAECAGLLYLAESLDDAPMAGALPVTAAMAPRLTLRYPEATAPADSLLTRAGELVTGHEFHRTSTEPAAGASAAWEIDGAPTGFATDTLHASYLHVHWAGHPQIAQRFADAAHAASVVPAPPVTVEVATSLVDPLLHHGDAESGAGLLDLAVNVHHEPRPVWLEQALRDSLADAARYPDAGPAAEAIAARHGREVDEVLPTAGVAEAFGLIAGLRAWGRAVVVHPQFTEPHAALLRAGRDVTTVIGRREDGFGFDPADVPDDADLVVIGNPTNPTGVLHAASALTKLTKAGRLVVVDEAFMDVVPGEPESLAGERHEGMVVLRSLTKQWSIPGIRAGYAVGDRAVIAELADAQTPWSVSAPAIAAMVACSGPDALAESQARAETVARWRGSLVDGLAARGVDVVPSHASFVLAHVGPGVHAALRARGVAC
ncbi:MAG: cobyrinate a,c-diamide synthase, partial [Myxococcales bacterium]